MLRKIQTLKKTYYVKWYPETVCDLLLNKTIQAGDLVQQNARNNKKLIKEFYLLACQASLRSTKKDKKVALILCRYAKAIRQICIEYDFLFERTMMIDTDNQDTKEQANNCIDRLQARLFYLITQYSFHPCKHLAANIVHQLTCLCQHPHIELMPAQQYIYSQSLNLWRSKLVLDNKVKSGQLLH